MCVRKDRSSSWIRRDKRWSIYAKHEFTCAYCGKNLNDGIMLTLDHVTPIELGGSNDVTNLVACCWSCNAVKGQRSTRSFLAYLRKQGVDTDEIRIRVRRFMKRTNNDKKIASYRKHLDKETIIALRKILCKQWPVG